MRIRLSQDPNKMLQVLKRRKSISLHLNFIYYYKLSIFTGSTQFRSRTRWRLVVAVKEVDGGYANPRGWRRHYAFG